MKLISNGRGGTREAASTPALIAGTMVSSDLVRARRFYEDFLGLECVQHAPDRLLIRDKISAELMPRGEAGGFVIEVQKVDAVRHPQKLHNHWGIVVASTDEVDRIRAIALAEGEKYGIRKVNPITKMHGSYQFYFIDLDENWWEIEHRLHGRTMEMVFEDGDFKRVAKPSAQDAGATK